MIEIEKQDTLVETERFIDDDDNVFYFIKGTKILHREGGPAAQYIDGEKEWYTNGKLHREDGPAIIRYNGSKEWYLKGKLHREDGPAVIDSKENIRWYLEGIRLSKEKWFEALNEEQKEKMLYSPDFI
jgi:hypothetical protein